MRVSVFAVGRMKSGPERDLAARYLDRLAKVGPPLGIDYGGLTEIAESRARSSDQRREEESRALLDHGDMASIILLDERGKNLSSKALAAHMAKLRDEGIRNLVFAIGGPDGHGDAARQAAGLTIAFGAQTWPHQFVRVMLAEQLYRAVTILAGHPYHRD